jgi:hypothetical protein
MRHAGDEDLTALGGLLASLRAMDGLTEKRPGVFYRRSKSLLHFHADGDDRYADIRIDPSEPFVRMRVTTKAEQRALLSSIRRAIGSGPPPHRS